MFASLHRELCVRWNKKRVKEIIFEVCKRGGFAWVTINTGSHDDSTSALIKNVKAKIKEILTEKMTKPFMILNSVSFSYFTNTF